MPFSIAVQPSGHQFSAETNDSILGAALRAGIHLPYGCKNGACGSCRGKVLEGRVKHGPHSSSALHPDDEAKGFALFCCAHPETDCVIEAREVKGAGDIQARKLPFRVAALERVAPDVIIVRLQLPANDKLQYLAGQYVEIILKDGKRRSYSMASAPHLAEQLELHIRHLPGGVFTDHVFGVGATTIKDRDILRFEGPFGNFFLREDSDKPMIFLASGTGFAPIKAVIEYAQLKNVQRPMTLYWGGRRPQDLYLNELAKSWETQLPNFRYVPVISDALPEDAWTGRRGFVHRAVMEDFADLSGHQVYACGAPIVVNSAKHDFIDQCGLPEEEFFADSFTTEADLAQ